MSRAGRWCCLLLGVAVLTSACGQSEFRYVTNRSTRTYLKVPRSWTRFDEAQLVDAEARATVRPGQDASELDKAVQKAIQWRVAFDADKKPSLDHVIGLGRRPAVDVRVRKLLDDERDTVNLAALRNLVVDYDGLKQQASQVSGAGAADTGFRPIVEDELAPGKGVHGVHLIFQLRGPDGGIYILNQTSLVDADVEHVYLLLIQAGDREYLDQRDVLNKIASSFTIDAKT